MVAALQAFEDGVPLVNVCDRWAISATTLYEWRRQYAGLPVAAVARLEQLSQDNARLRRHAAALERDREILREAIWLQVPEPKQRRALTSGLVGHFGISLAYACRLVGISRSYFCYESASSETSSPALQNKLKSGT